MNKTVETNLFETAEIGEKSEEVGQSYSELNSFVLHVFFPRMHDWGSVIINAAFTVQVNHVLIFAEFKDEWEIMDYFHTAFATVSLLLIIVFTLSCIFKCIRAHRLKVGES